MKVTFLQSTAERPQALRVKAEGASLTANGITVNDAIYWTDTAPMSFDVAIEPSRGGGRLKIWNEWRNDAGVQHAWIGNAGMVVVPSAAASEILFKCSDGIGEPAFDDLVVQVRIVPNVIDFAAARDRRRPE